MREKKNKRYTRKSNHINDKSGDIYTLVNSSLNSELEENIKKCEVCGSNKNIHEIPSCLKADYFSNKYNLCKTHGIQLKLYDIQSKFGEGKSVIDQYTYAEALYELHVRESIAEHSSEFQKKLDSMYTYIDVFTSPKNKIKFTDEHIKKIEKLETKIPNATALIEHIKLAIYASIETNNKLKRRIDPILLVGPPGIGKTYSMFEIANILQIDCANIQLSNIKSSFEFCGLEAKWRSPSIGQYAKALAGFKSHTGIIFLDELDKVSIHFEHGSIFDALLMILESDSCSKFCDALLGLPMYADDIFFIATANTTKTIPSAILSRFTIIEIKPPNSNQMKEIINTLYDKEIKQWSEIGYECLPIEKGVINLLENLSIREIKLLIKTGISRSAFQCRNKNKKVIQLTKNSLSSTDLMDDVLNKLENYNDFIH